MISGINEAQFLRVTIESICTIVIFIWFKPMLMNTKSDIWVLLFTLIQWCLSTLMPNYVWIRLTCKNSLFFVIVLHLFLRSELNSNTQVNLNLVVSRFKFWIIVFQTKDALCQVWLKLAQWFWRKRFLNFISVFSHIRNYLPLEKEVALHLNKLVFLLPKDALCQVLFWDWSRVLENKIFKFR